MSILKEQTLSYLPPDLVEKSKNMSTAYEYLYCIENILRLFLINHSSRNNFLISTNLTKTITDRKKDELANKWLPLRGNDDFFYLDFKDLASIISNNWQLMQNNFPSQNWIVAKIEDLTKCRNLIAHNSYIDDHGLNFVKTYFNMIIRQLNIHSGSVSNWDSIPPNSSFTFIEGLKNSVIWTKKEAEEGLTHQLVYPADLNVAPISIRALFYQIDILFFINFVDTSVRIMPSFTVGTDTDGEMVCFKDDVIFQIGQYDIDNDGLDELFIGVLDNDGNSDNGLQINVFKYYPPAYKEHAYRESNWELIGNFTGEMVLGDPKAFIKGTSVTIPRNLRGFYYEWTYVKGEFMDTGNN